MAKAKLGTSFKKVTKTITEDVPVKEVQLTLSEDEAKALSAILRRVGGPPNFIRGDVDAIHEALKGAIGNWHADLGKDHLEGSIYFGKINASDLQSYDGNW